MVVAALGVVQEEDDDVKMLPASAALGGGNLGMAGPTADALHSPLALHTGVGGVETGGGGGVGGTGGGGAGLVVGGAGDETKVPSRLAVKKVSAQTNLEAKRKEDMEARRKR